MARDNGRRGAYLHADDTGEEKKQRQHQQKNTTKKPGEDILSSPDSNNSSSVTTTNDDTMITNVTATSPKPLVSFSPNHLDNNPNNPNKAIATGLGTRGNIFGDSTSSTTTTATDKFFDQAPDELNARFPVGSHDLSATVPPGAAAEDSDSSSMSFLSSPFLRHPPHRRRWRSAESGVTWKHAVVANLAVLVAVGGFTVIMCDGVRWIARFMWEMFCGLVGRLMD